MRQLLPVMIVLICAACQQKPAPAATALQDSLQTPELAPSAVEEPVNAKDTVTIGDRLFYFRDVAQSEFDAIPALVPDTSEAANIATAAGKVVRSGDSLIMQLGNGGQKVLVQNHHDGDDYAQFTFQGYMPEIQRWLVLNIGYEWFSYELISTHTGESISTIGIPRFSPDKKYFLTSNADLVAEFTTNGFELYQITKDGAVAAQNYFPEKWGPVDIRWKDANTLYGEIKEVNEQMEETTRYVKFTLQ